MRNDLEVVIEFYKIMKVLLAILILVWLNLGWMAIQPQRSTSAYYKATVLEGSRTLSETPWLKISEQEMRSSYLKIKVVMWSLLALNTLGIVYIARRLWPKSN